MDDLLSETVSLSESEMTSVEPPEPKSIGSGIVKSVLGKGGASVVYEIWNPKLEIFRAVKLWRIVHSEKTIQRFENETKITAKLNHPNIVEIYTVGEWNGLPYIEMEKIQGTNLKELIKSNETFPEIVVTAVAISICRALVYAHNHKYSLSGKTCKGVVHCDIKPANIMISQSGIVKLMDFGIAHPSNNANSTEKNSVTGSLQYMSPEQLESKPVGPRSDLYSFGVLLYELYSGTKAFYARSLKELIQKRNDNEFSPLNSFCKNISAKARDIVEKLMKIDPDERFQSADELLDELQKLYQKATDLQPEVVISRFLSGNKMYTAKRKNKLKIVLPLLLILSGLSAAVYMTVNKNHVIKESTFKQFYTDSLAVDSSASMAHDEKNVPLSQAPADSAIKNIYVAKSRRSQIKKINKTVSSASASKKIENSSGSEVIEIETKNVTFESVLDDISGLLQKGDIAAAESMARKFPLNDGEYHLVYAEILLKKNQLSAAMSEVQKALRVPASRISPVELRSKILYLKACILASEYDKSPEKQTGQVAMEAWYEVKYSYRSNTSHPYYIKADTEIRRISASLQ